MRRLWALLAGAAVTDLGGGLFQLCLPWLVYDVSRSAFWLGIVAMVQALSLWGLPLLGVLADRYDRRRLLIIALAVQGLTSGGLALLAADRVVSIEAILAAAILMALGQRLQLLSGSVARRVLTPVGERVRFNSWWANISLLASYGAPGLAGFLIAWHGVAWTLFLLALTVLPMLAAALGLPALAAEPDHRPPFDQLRSSFDLLRSETGLWRYTLFFSFWNWTWSGAMAVMVYFYRHTLHFSAGQVGLVGLLGGAIPVLVSFAGQPLQRWLGPGRILTAGLVVSGIGMIVLPTSNGPLMVGSVLGLLDGPIGPILAALSTISQSRIAEDVYGRVMAVRGLVAQALTPVAALAAGTAAGIFGAGPVIQTLGGITLIGGMSAPLFALNRIQLDGRTRDAADSGDSVG